MKEKPHAHPIRYNRSFALGVILNLAFVGIEAVYGVLAGSLALVADAGHNLSDVVSLLLAWGAAALATKNRSKKRTYGFRKATVLASLASAILLLAALGIITWEAVGRFLDPKPATGMTVIVVAGIGVVINTLTAMLFFKGRKDDLNVRGAYLHMAADAGVSLGVVVAGVLIMIKGWLWVDPVASLMVVAVVFVATWGLLRNSLGYAMDAVPEGIDIPEIERYLESHDRVVGFHDLHVWPLSTTETALTVHLLVDYVSVDNGFLAKIQHDLQRDFRISHATIQVETSKGENNCRLDDE